MTDLTYDVMSMKRIFRVLTGFILLSLQACSGKDMTGTELAAPPVPEPDVETEGLYDKEEGVTRLVTYNIGSFSKTPQSSCSMVSSMMTELGADIISFNELDKNTSRSGRVDQLAQVTAGMRGWKYVFAKAIDFQGGEYGNGIAYNPETTGEPLSQFTIPFPDAAEPRVCLVLEFEDFVFASTHLEVSSSSERVAEVKKITETLKDRFSDNSKPVFLAGDMNELPNESAIMELGREWSMISANSPTYPSSSPKTCIDMIFMMDGHGECEVKAAAVANRFVSGDVSLASDHLPSYADIFLTDEN